MHVQLDDAITCIFFTIYETIGVLLQQNCPFPQDRESVRGIIFPQAEYFLFNFDEIAKLSFRITRFT